MAFDAEKGLGGAAQGAAIGTAIGGPGLGTAIGAGGGLLLGFLGGDDGDDAERARIRADIRARQPSRARATQDMMVGMLNRRAQGKDLFTPTLVRQQQGQNLQQQMSLAAGAPRGQSALAGRAAAQNAARINQQAALQSLLGSLRERQQAEDAMARLLGDIRSLDIQRELGTDRNLLASLSDRPSTGERLLSGGLGALNAGISSGAFKSDSQGKPVGLDLSGFDQDAFLAAQQARGGA